MATATNIREFVRHQITDEPQPYEPTTQIVSIRLEIQTIADLEDLAGRLDMTRSMLARRLIEAGMIEAEEAYETVFVGTPKKRKKGVKASD